jgi:signal peptidase II
VSRGPSKWTVLVVLFVVLVLFDQWTKFLAVDRLTTVFQQNGDVTLAQKVRGFYTHRHLELHATAPHVVWAPMWRMVYVENPGAAWGLFRAMPERARNAFFTVVLLVAAVFILGYYRRLRPGQRLHQVALSFLLAGAVGNFLDRLARRYVIDFVDWHAGSFHWPTFNVADSLIVVGVALLILQPGQRKEAEAAARGPGVRAAKERGA